MGLILPRRTAAERGRVPAGAQPGAGRGRCARTALHRCAKPSASPAELRGQGLVGREKRAHPRTGVAALAPCEAGAEIFNMNLDPRPVTGDVGHGHAPLLPDHSGLAANGCQRDLDGLLLRLARLAGQHQQPPQGLAGFRPPRAFPSAGKDPRAILAAHSRSPSTSQIAPPRVAWSGRSVAACAGGL